MRQEGGGLELQLPARPEEFGGAPAVWKPPSPGAAGGGEVDGTLAGVAIKTTRSLRDEHPENNEMLDMVLQKEF